MNFNPLQLGGINAVGGPLSGIGMMNGLMNAGNDPAPAPNGVKPTGLVDGEKAPGGGKEGLQGILQGLGKKRVQQGIPDDGHIMAELMPSSASQFLESLFANSMR